MSEPSAPRAATRARTVRRPQDGRQRTRQGPEVAATVIVDDAQLDSLRGSWDSLAVALGAPFGSPAWAEAWWRHLAPRGARLAVVAVHAGEELVGLAPFYSSRRLGVTELRLLSGGFASRLGILARPGHEREVAAAIVRALTDAGLVPDVFRLEAVDAASPWAGWLSASWPDGRGYHLQEISELSAPILSLGKDSFDEWFAERSAHFRRNMRRDRRQIEKKGASFRRGDRASLERDLAAFGRLHSARREGRGGSRAVTTAAMVALQEVGEKLIDSGRFRMWMIDGPDGEAISAHLFVEAGGTLAFWNTGFDERWSKHSPGAIGLLAAIEDALERGDELIDLGGGEASYKRRLADEDRPVAWRTSYRLGARYPLARLRRLPEQVARRGSSKLRERPVAHRTKRLRQLLKH